MKTIKIILDEPIRVAGREQTEIIMRRPTVGDEEDAMEESIQHGRGKNPVTLELCLFSKLTRLPYDAIRSMDDQEYAKLKEAYLELKFSARKVEENPTQTAGTVPVISMSCAVPSSPLADTAAGQERNCGE